MTKKYDYIITGAGCAGLSLLMRMQSFSFFQDKKILVIDASEKKGNDRTWCFWEQQSDIFQPIVCKEWSSIEFLAEGFSKTYTISPYQYKMIKGVDFYNYCHQALRKNGNITWLNTSVERLYTNEDGLAVAVTKDGHYTGEYVFNSIVFDQPTPKKGQYYFLQHFMGWEIETTDPAFDDSTARFMDFSIDQSKGTSFMYVLPQSPTKALVEYTLFTKQLLTEQAYKDALSSYIQTSLNIEAYSITHSEFGVIPMTNIRFPQQEKNVVHIGIAGNQAKASSGYAFKFIQKRAAQIVDLLRGSETNFSKQSFNDKKAALYDATLLRVLDEEKMKGAAIFAALFKGNSPQALFSFLDNESSLLTDLQIMNSVPTLIFLPAALKQLVAEIYLSSLP